MLTPFAGPNTHPNQIPIPKKKEQLFFGGFMRCYLFSFSFTGVGHHHTNVTFHRLIITFYHPYPTLISSLTSTKNLGLYTLTLNMVLDLEFEFVDASYTHTHTHKKNTHTHTHTHTHTLMRWCVPEQVNHS